MGRQIVVTLEQAGTGYIGPRWVVRDIRNSSVWDKLRKLLSFRSNSADLSNVDYSTKIGTPDIGVGITWDQYNTLADKIGTVKDDDMRSLCFVHPPYKPTGQEISI